MAALSGNSFNLLNVLIFLWDWMTSRTSRLTFPSMFSRAQIIVFWPGMTDDIEDARASCSLCHQNAPSRAKLPPTAPTLPTTPFEMIYSDFFKLQGNHLLINGYRLSAWTEVVKVAPSTGSSGTKNLCEAFLQVFKTFVVPEEISSDSGPGFVAKETTDFCTRWEYIQHVVFRVFSAI